MDPREFSAALAGMDRPRWPVQPAAAEKAMNDYYRLVGHENMTFTWVDSPLQLPRTRQTLSFGMQEAIQRFNRWRFPTSPDEFWVVSDDQACEGEMIFQGGYPESRGVAHAAVLRLLLDAYMAGAIAVFEYGQAAYIVSRPVMRVDDRGRLHHETKPAVAWFQGPYKYFIHGVEVEERIVTNPSKITLADIQDLDNMEVRRVVIERFGWRRYLRSLGAWKMDEDPVHGVLWSASAPRGDQDWGGQMRLLELKDPSTDRRYFIRVPPTRRTALSARAWTFNKTIGEFQTLAKET